ncbi:hypothetical protein GBA52_028029 [Prunus armeniaca]|nr:hypothetical protein GBA52_028029 [Prunus armeniaca]
MWIQGSRTRRRKISTRIEPETNGVDQEIAKGRSKRHNLVRSQRASLDSPAQHDHCTGDDW